MNYIIFFYYAFLSIFSVNSTKPKLCIDCKFFKKDFFTDNKFGKCSLFSKEESNYNYLVDGSKKVNIIGYYFSSTARGFNHMCGEEGKFYEKKNTTYFKR
jgi:hypothetical protein